MTRARNAKGTFVALRSERAKAAYLSGEQLQIARIGVLQSERQRNDEIRIDRDHAATPELRRLWRKLRLWSLSPKFILDVRTRRGWHRTVRLREPLTDAEQVATQSLCGSDEGRETLNLMRTLSIRRDGADPFTRARWNLLFARKLRKKGCA